MESEILSELLVCGHPSKALRNAVRPARDPGLNGAQRLPGLGRNLGVGQALVVRHFQRSSSSGRHGPQQSPHRLGYTRSVGSPAISGTPEHHVFQFVFRAPLPQRVDRPIPGYHCQPCAEVPTACVESPGISPYCRTLPVGRLRPPRYLPRLARPLNTPPKSNGRTQPPLRFDRRNGLLTPAPRRTQPL